MPGIFLHINIILFLLISILLPLSSHAEESEDIITLEPVVVTASRVEEPLSEVSASIGVISRKDIEERQDEKVDEALRGVSGVKINSYGGADPYSWVLIRGSDYDHVLVLIDGVEINTPYDYAARIGSIQTNNIERIEVLKGSHSAIYGSEAIGGVINIITKEKKEADLSVKGGNYETWRESFFHSDKKKDISYSLGYSRLDTKGNIYTGTFSGNTLSGNVKFPIGDYSSVQISSFYWDHEKLGAQLCCELDSNQDMRFTLPDKSIDREYDWINSIQFNRYFSDLWDYRIQYNRYDFKGTWDLQGNSKLPYPFRIDSRNTGSRDVFEMQNNLYLHESDTLTVGLQYRGESVSIYKFGNSDSLGMGESKEQPSVSSFRDSKAVYIQNLLKLWDRLIFSAGARIEDGLGFGNEIVPRASLSYLFPSTNTKIKGGYGKGIRAASIRHLYDPIIGDRDLRPEKSENYEAAIEQRIKNFDIGLTYFHSTLRDLIEWGDDINYINVGKAWTKGYEAEIYGRDIFDSFDIRLSYTNLDTKDEDKDKPLRFRASDYYSIDLRYRGIERLILALSSEIVGESYDPYPFLKDINGNNLPERTPSYKLVNIAASYLIEYPPFKRIELELKVNNLFNESYSEIGGFHTLGTNFLAGMSIGF